MVEPKNKNMLERMSDGRYRIREKIIVDGRNAIKIPLNESNKFIEINGEQFACRGAYAGVEISRPDKKNLNERIYTGKLWELVINDQKSIWDGGSGLANHPEREGDVLKTFCIWRNLRFNEKKDLIVADMYLVGEHTGQLAKEILDAGGKLGLSSSGYGDFKEDGITIDESTYELERVADWVDAPSYGVFARKDNEVKSENKENLTVEENKNDKKVQLSEIESTNITEKNNSKENSMNEIVNKKLASIEEKNFRINLGRLINEAEKKESLSDKLDEYKEILTYFEGINFASDLKEKVENLIDSLTKEIVALAEKGKNTDSLQESSKLSEEKNGKLEEENKSLKEKLEKIIEKYEIAQNMLKEIRDYANNLKEINRITIAEKNGMVDPEEYIILHKKYESLLAEQDEEDDEKEGDEEEEMDDEKEGDEEEKMDDEKEKEDEIYDFSNKHRVEAYYKDLVEQYPKVKNFKEKFLKCKTIFEAQKLWLNIEDDLYKLPFKNPLVTEKYSAKYESFKKSRGINRLIHEGWE